MHYFYTGAEVGYALPLGPVIVRPYGGVGLVVASFSQKVGSQESSKSDSALAIWPGITVLYEIPRSAFFVGGDSRVVIVTNGGDASFAMFATAGMRF